VLNGVEATRGIEPLYAVLQTAPWTTRARRHTVYGWLPREDSNLGSRIHSPLTFGSIRAQIGNLRRSDSRT
jgi:hypothetical protein